VKFTGGRNEQVSLFDRMYREYLCAVRYCIAS